MIPKLADLFFGLVEVDLGGNLLDDLALADTGDDLLAFGGPVLDGRSGSLAAGGLLFSHSVFDDADLVADLAGHDDGSANCRVQNALCLHYLLLFLFGHRPIASGKCPVHIEQDLLVLGGEPLVCPDGLEHRCRNQFLVDQPSPFVEGVGADLEGSRQALENLGRRLANPSLDLAQIWV